MERKYGVKHDFSTLIHSCEAVTYLLLFPKNVGYWLDLYPVEGNSVGYIIIIHSWMIQVSRRIEWS
jgi:hypothetical protein